MELAKIKLQIQGEGIKYGAVYSKEYNGTINCLLKIYQVKGLPGLYTGKLVYKYTGYLDCIRKSISADGYKVFGKGLNAALLRAFPTNAATFFVSCYAFHIT
ncbi:SLC25A29 [Bugula neritina]|uniref:SLC25A29 n=1 Tax=Bugula neritina TaxID=10212 RepID=A0A7J7J6S0_BUGNE|nr:SLC25A29 [Bugula neritina]